MSNPAKSPKISWKNIYQDMTETGVKESFLHHLHYTLAKDQYSATEYDNYQALSLAVRDRIVQRWIETQQRYHKQNLKRVYYLSMEFLIGRLMGNNVYNLGLEKAAATALDSLGLSLENVREQEVDAGLGNGGLGRLAACFLDSMASLGIPAHGYGIRYEYGIFRQKIKNGYQEELPDEWLRHGFPWEFARPEYTAKVHYYGRVENSTDDKGRPRSRWVDTYDVMAVPYDIPVVGYKNDVVNTLRLWSSRSTEDFDFEYFNDGDYEKAVYSKIMSENISKVLYPNDSAANGRELRLKQEYFFTAAAITDIIRRYQSENNDLRKLHEKIAIQLNDTHPAIAIAELLRVLIDDYRLTWDEAWATTKQVFAYTNHTLMPEALECWSVELLGRVLPRHLQIIYEINARFLSEVSVRFPGEPQMMERVSLVQEGEQKKIRMAYLSIVGSHAVNGVSKLHSELLTKTLFHDFYRIYPDRFNNKTNGITQRRWLLKSNPALADLITETIGDQWVSNLDELDKLKGLREKADFRKKWQAVKKTNKENFAEYLQNTSGITVDPSTLFDVQVKRMHEYKRQFLFALYMVSQYLCLKNDPKKFVQPRTFFVGGKAAPAYMMAKLVIKFINSLAYVINGDPEVKGRLKVVFLENYRVSLAEKIFPASDLSEQISTAGTEASGTGNMKFMLNGALTVGTMDGANVEIADLVGKDNIYIFGLKTPEVANLRPGYQPQDFINRSAALREIMDLIRSNFFSRYEPGIFEPLYNAVVYHDPFLVCADFEDYVRVQDVISRDYLDAELWTKRSIMNVARSGFFSSDRTIREYAKDIWKVDTAGK
ncbi:MAG: glycogen/starch/alpha-glucan phosphorylase [Candidatus Omnitrophica bacterium]|nr:glycogen/starch/alpha-glucan phosphorylase [Candidatus Omnitrophota bacterium]